MKKRTLTYAQAIQEGMDIALSQNKHVFVIGESVPDPRGIFGTTVGLNKKYPDRVLDMPVSENGMTGICIGAALAGLRPIIVHQRIDFTLYAFDQMINSAAKWYFMFGQKQSVPIVIRVVIGRGWGPGPQHSQSLQALFAHIPGLKVVMPATPSDAKGLLLAAVTDNNPVIYIEHRWLHNITGVVPGGYYEVPIGKSSVVKKGNDITIATTSYMTVEAVKSLDILTSAHISAELIDIRSLKPFDTKTLLQSVHKTRRLLVADTGVKSFGVTAEVVTQVVESGIVLKSPPKRITLPDVPTPTSWKLAEQYYPTSVDIVAAALLMCGKKQRDINNIVAAYRKTLTGMPDQPDPSFTGPF